MTQHRPPRVRAFSRTASRFEEILAEDCSELFVFGCLPAHAQQARQERVGLFESRVERDRRA